MPETSEHKDTQPAKINRRGALIGIVSLLTGIGIGNVLNDGSKDGLKNEPVFEKPFDAEHIGWGKVLILYSADWCPACIQAGKILKQYENTFRAHGIRPFEFYQRLTVIPHQDWSPLAVKLNKEPGIPVVLIFSEGKLIKTFTGIDTDKENDILKLPCWIEANF